MLIGWCTELEHGFVEVLLALRIVTETEGSEGQVKHINANEALFWISS